MNDNILRNTTYRLTLNELKTIEFNGEVHNFSFQAIQNQMYVVVDLYHGNMVDYSVINTF